MVSLAAVACQAISQSVTKKKFLTTPTLNLTSKQLTGNTSKHLIVGMRTFCVCDDSLNCFLC